MEPKIIYGEPTKRATVHPPEPQGGTKAGNLERHLAEALADLIDPIRPSEVGNRINSAFNLIERVQCDLADALASEYERGLADGRGDGCEQWDLGKAAGIAEANERILATSRMQYTAGREDGFASGLIAHVSSMIEHDRCGDELRGR